MEIIKRIFFFVNNFIFRSFFFEIKIDICCGNVNFKIYIIGVLINIFGVYIGDMQLQG